VDTTILSSLDFTVPNEEELKDKLARIIRAYYEEDTRALTHYLSIANLKGYKLHRPSSLEVYLAIVLFRPSTTASE